MTHLSPKNDVCFGADSFNVKEVYKSCVKVFNRKVLNTGVIRLGVVFWGLVWIVDQNGEHYTSHRYLKEEGIFNGEFYME